MNTAKTRRPLDFYEDLSQKVIGQDEAKKALAIAAYQHLQRVNYDGPGRLEKSNVLLIGPTGCGKTLLVKTLADMMGVPFAIANATSLTETGYVGADVESALTPLLDGHSVAEAERGIVFIDEIDKLAGTNPMERVSSLGVQQDLLKILEGSEVSIPKSAHVPGMSSGHPGTTSLDTEDILFICAGAFNGIEKVVAQRVDPHVQHRLRDDRIDMHHYVSQVEARDLIEYGLTAEFVGRLPAIVPLKALTTQELSQVLTEPTGSLTWQYEMLFTLDHIDLTFERDALDLIAETAQKNGTGARGLRALLEKVLREWMFTMPGSDARELSVTPRMVRDRLGLPAGALQAIEALARKRGARRIT